MDGAITIHFDGNGADGGSMDLQGIGIGQSANLNANQFTREGYKFTGWNTVAGGTGTSYGDGANYTAPANPSSYTITLYAQWEQDITYIQDFTLAECQAKASDANFTVIDKRDGNDYTVRYINGNCWMTQNLRIAGGTTLNSSTSNVASNYIIPTTDLTSGDSYTEGRIHDSGNTSDGYWYNFCAASAGTRCSNGSSADATVDICPKGWELPTHNVINTLAPDFTYSLTYSSIISPVANGYYSSGKVNNFGSYGGWWSSTGTNTGKYWRLYYNVDRGLYAGDTQGYRGFSVRCIRSS